MGQDHPLLDLLSAAAHGEFPPADGRVDILPSPPGPSHAVVAFTAHSVVAVDLEPEAIRSRLDPVDLGSPMSPGFLSWVTSALRRAPGVLDLVMVAPDVPRNTEVPPLLEARDDLSAHPRVERSARYRRDLRCYADPKDRAVVTLGRGLAGRWEVAVEVAPEHRGQGLGKALARTASALVPNGEPLFAQVSPGNVASVRTFLAAGYRPICSEVLFLKQAA
jgi:GNAT superfamily N-acetyltransferase